MRRILDSYTLAHLGDAPLPTMALLHLITLPPGDKIKAHLIEKMRLTPNIECLDEVLVHILSQEADDLARRNTQDKIRRVNRALEEEEDKEPSVPKRKHKCRICDKEHERYKCTFKCKWCSKKGDRSENCWTKFPQKTPGYVPPPPQAPRERTLAPGLRKPKGRRSRSMDGSDRASSYDGNESELGNTPRGNRKKRARSKRVRAVGPSEGNSSLGTAGFSSNGGSLFPRRSPNLYSSLSTE